jgi:hypothetical protein
VDLKAVPAPLPDHLLQDRLAAEENKKKIIFVLIGKENT